jgi:signal-transduction protein with cAMP-binding, CBS, and nucleotidyltransferase domain
MKNPFQKSYSAEDVSLFNFLSGVRIFEQLNDDEKAYFVPYLYLRKYKQDEVVFFRKDPSHALYVIKRGKISIFHDVGEEMEILNQVGSSHSFGNNALISNTNRIYNAIVNSESAELYVIPHVNIMDIFAANPKIQAKMLASLTEMYDEYTKQLFASYKSSKGFFSLDLLYTTF